MATTVITWRDVLSEIASWTPPIRTAAVARHFGRGKGEMFTRLHTLRRWGYLRYADRSQRGAGGYVVTEWGHACVARWREGSDEAADR